MDYALNDKMVAILEIIDKSPGPMGSWALSERLKEKGIYTSSATVGRLLNSLECAGYLERSPIPDVRLRMQAEKNSALFIFRTI